MARNSSRYCVTEWTRTCGFMECLPSITISGRLQFPLRIPVIPTLSDTTCIHLQAGGRISPPPGQMHASNHICSSATPSPLALRRRISPISLPAPQSSDPSLPQRAIPRAPAASGRHAAASRARAPRRRRGGASRPAVRTPCVCKSLQRRYCTFRGLQPTTPAAICNIAGFCAGSA
ncbi:hypothetical protein BV20DRAFT_455210 [Pilatotrama ljubarskyi]|nr:hypothetical protein BV20DRAFT_455210 [Pilatotrama ljubarskyi]